MTIPMPSWFEISAIFFTTVCIFLAGRNNIHTWWAGLIGCVLFGFLFYDARLYADVVLQGFFFMTGILGWILWRRNGLNIQPLIKLKLRSYFLVLLSGILVAGCYGWMLSYFTDAAAPFVDSTVLALSVAAQILLMARYVQTWPTWVIVNLVAVPLFWSRELYLTSIVYGFYLVHACYACYHWLTFNKRT